MVVLVELLLAVVVVVMVFSFRLYYVFGVSTAVAAAAAAAAAATAAAVVIVSIGAEDVPWRPRVVSAPRGCLAVPRSESFGRSGLFFVFGYLLRGWLKDSLADERIE